MKICIALLFILVSALALSACASPAPATTTSAIEVTDAWVQTVRGMDMGGSGSATTLFMNIRNNGNSTDMLLQIESDVARMVQIASHPCTNRAALKSRLAAWLG